MALKRLLLKVFCGKWHLKRQLFPVAGTIDTGIRIRRSWRGWRQQGFVTGIQAEAGEFRYPVTGIRTGSQVQLGNFGRSNPEMEAVGRK